MAHQFYKINVQGERGGWDFQDSQTIFPKEARVDLSGETEFKSLLTMPCRTLDFNDVTVRTYASQTQAGICIIGREEYFPKILSHLERGGYKFELVKEFGDIWLPA